MCKEKLKIFAFLLALTGLFIQCEKDALEDENIPIVESYQLEALDKPIHYPGIAIYTADMAKNRTSDINSEWVVRTSSSVSASSEIARNQFNAIHKINYQNVRSENDYVEFVVSLFGPLVNRVSVPNDITKDLTSISFRSVNLGKEPMKISLEARNINGVAIKTESFDLTINEMSLFKMDISDETVHHLSFKIYGNSQASNSGSIGLDDIYLNNNSTIPSTPPTNDAELLSWLKQSNIRYFLWNYKDLGGNRGVVLEASDNPTKVSVSGIGYAYAMYILAEDEGMVSGQVARNRILAMLNWQKDQNWFNGSQGKFGFPFHYYNSDGSGLYSNSPEAASTIDWAICAAGLRTVKQKYSSDPTIVSICNELLNRPEWEKMIHNDANDSYKYGRITKGISGITGEKNGQVWGDAFTEESEIIYLEALASGKVDNLDLDRIFREQKNGFYVSWFGCGFTYNWSQLWTGTVEPYKTNSADAFQADANTSNSSFGRPVMGLTACSTFSTIDSNGFAYWDKYMGYQGSNVSGANTSEVVQVSPAPYGAALALPFIPNTAITALKEYVNIGYYHPLLGLPDNVRLNDLPNSLDVPIPNWSTFDINIGPMGMAIDMYQQKIISTLYMKDDKVKNSLEKLIQSF
tara:strand:- start:1204 stop:3105 length:1902 start_codon:yes stop_codon:yes gene_type:complete